MARAFRLPDLGEGLAEGEIVRWLVVEGQEIAEDDPLLEVQTDKATVEIPSPWSGTVLRILAAEGEVVPVGRELVLIGEPGEALGREAGGIHLPAVDEAEGVEREPAPQGGVAVGQPTGRAAPPGAAAPPSSPAAPPRSPAEEVSRVRATPLVRKLARELGVDLAVVVGSGPEGRITEDDVRAEARAPTPGEGRREPLRGIRRAVAEHLTRAHRDVPAVTWVEECDFGAVHLPHLVATVLKACAEALPEYPELNARLEGDEIVYLDRYDLGVAVHTDQGLVVPVVRRVDERSIEEIHAEIARLAEAARHGTLRPEELRGSTFTVTSAGKLAGLFQTPLVNTPEVAILSVGRIAQRPVVREAEIVVRPMGTIAITFDHRVVDGVRAASFGLAVIARIEAGP